MKNLLKCMMFASAAFFVLGFVSCNNNVGGDDNATKTAGSISYATTSVSKTTADGRFTNTLTKTGDGAVTYSSSNTDAATVNASTGEVTIVGAGSTTITATVTDSDTYTYATKTARYTLTVTQESTDPWKGDLSNIPTTELETDGVTLIIADGMTLTNTLAGNYKIIIADGATVTLDGIAINGTNDSSYNWAGLNCEGDATIILKDGTMNIVKGFQSHHPGILPAVGKTLTIKGTGSLNVSSNGWAAGIGGGDGNDCGNIDIQDGTITATGGINHPGIGSGKGKACGNITISGGTVTATGGNNAPGIGTGYYGTCGDITITDGVTKVTATKGGMVSNSIGNCYGTCGTITIGGTVTGDISTNPYTYEPSAQ